MLTYIARRLVSLIPIAFVMSVVVFTTTMLLPGDPAVSILGQASTAEQREAIREQLGLNDPLPVQYGRWLGRMVVGDLGKSIVTKQPVLETLRQRMPVTIELMFLSTLLAVAIGVPAGILAATRRGSAIDTFASLIAMGGIAIPYFWLGVLLILLFAVNLHWLPPSGYVAFSVNPGENLRLMILPAVTVGSGTAAIIMRQTRTSVLETLGNDFIRTARSKGLHERVVIYKHALKNAMLSVSTVIGLQVSALIGGAVVTETVFAMPGLGRLIVDGIFRRDFPVVTGSILFVVVGVLLINLLTDLSYVALDPRIQQA